MKKDMARRGLPLAYTPAGPVWEHDLDLNWSERRKLLVGWLVVILFVVGVAIAAGGS